MDITGELFEDQFLPHMVQARLVEAKELSKTAIRDPPFALEQGAHQVLIEAQHGMVDNAMGRHEVLVTRPRRMGQRRPWRDMGGDRGVRGNRDGGICPDQSSPRVIDHLRMRVEELSLEVLQRCVVELELPLGVR